MKTLANMLMTACVFAAAIWGYYGDTPWWIPVFAAIATPGIVLIPANNWGTCDARVALVARAFVVGAVSYSLFYASGRAVGWLVH